MLGSEADRARHNRRESIAYVLATIYLQFDSGEITAYPKQGYILTAH